MSEGYLPEELLGPLNDVERKNAPPRLWAAGDLEVLKAGSRVSIVGTRHPSPEGVRRATRLARFLVDHQVVVVSGLAAGIDTAAHRATIEHGGRTIAVIGCGIDVVFPTSNAQLQHRIAREHLLLSQFPPGTTPRKTNFPQRNRTMALMSDATVIVEAGESSRSLSQGWEALRLGRPLFIMRTVVEHPLLAWPREMIRYGAVPLAEPEQILAVVEPPAAGLAF